MESRHISAHVNTDTHIHHVDRKHSGRMLLSRPEFRVETPKTTQELPSRVTAVPTPDIPSSSQSDVTMEDSNVEDSGALTATDYGDKSQVLPDSFGYELDQCSAFTDDDQELPISQLWDVHTNSRIFLIGSGPGDIFDLLQAELANNRDVLSTAFAGIPVNEALHLDESNDDFSIKIQDDPFMHKVKKGFDAPVDSPYYPWPSKSHFITALLFSSARLPFSVAQKRAVLSWVKELSAQDVPSLYAVKKCHECISKTIGDATEMVKSRSGNIFYINNISTAIAMTTLKMLGLECHKFFMETKCRRNYLPPRRFGLTTRSSS
ncbi:hypothetical protein J3R83DRAFT_9939 [Lanmaoa asiatica]|nr:hypothetical protein J3R83DRAFT_9939 [Lanmaoa asiatica]